MLGGHLGGQKRVKLCAVEWGVTTILRPYVHKICSIRPP